MLFNVLCYSILCCSILLDYFILAQLIPKMNSPENIEEYECLPDEVKNDNSPIYCR